MSDRVRIADLPTSTVIDKDSFMLVERPGEGTGTYKTTLGDIQEAITVRAKVEQIDNITNIYVKDITGDYEASIFTPTAKVEDNGNNTTTITITDGSGTTQSTVVSRVIFDPYPIEDSNNLVSSGVVYNIKAEQDSHQATIENLIEQLEALTERVVTLEERVATLEEQNIDLTQRLSAVERVTNIALTIEQDAISLEDNTEN